MNIYPADEKRISDVERDRSCTAVVPLSPGGSLAPGDTILFALFQSRARQQPCYVNGGDSVRVLLTDVTALEAAEPRTGKGFVRLTWEPLGKNEPAMTIAKRVVKTPSLCGWTLRSPPACPP